MTPHVQAVMERYRELKGQGFSSLAASYQTRGESGFVPSGDIVPVTQVVCLMCLKRPPEKGRGKCSACRKSTYRERGKT